MEETSPQRYQPPPVPPLPPLPLLPPLATQSGEGVRTEGVRTEGERTEGERTEGERTEGERTESPLPEAGKVASAPPLVARGPSLAAEPGGRVYTYSYSQACEGFAPLRLSRMRARFDRTIEERYGLLGLAASLFPLMEILIVPPGTTIFDHSAAGLSSDRSARDAGALFVVDSGFVTVMMHLPKPAGGTLSYRLCKVTCGAVLGGAMLGGRSSASTAAIPVLPISVVANTFCQVLRLPAGELERLEAHDPPLACRLYKLLCLASQESERKQSLSTAASRVFGVSVQPSASLERLLVGGLPVANARATQAPTTPAAQAPLSRRTIVPTSMPLQLSNLRNPAEGRRAVPAALSLDAVPRKPSLPAALSLDAFETALHASGQLVATEPRLRPTLAHPSSSGDLQGQLRSRAGLSAEGSSAGITRRRRGDVRVLQGGRGLLLHASDESSSDDLDDG